MPVEKKKPTQQPGARRERFEALADQIRSDDDTSRLARSELAGSIGFLLRLTNGVVAAELGARFEVLGLRQSLYSVLLIIKENPGLKQQDVGQVLGIQQPNLVSLINELLAANLISRAVNADDRRSYSLSLTPVGKTRLAQASRMHEDNERRLEAALGSVSSEEFCNALRGILRAAASREASEEPGPA